MAIFHSFFMAELYFITYMYTGNIWASLVAQVVKNLPEMQEIWFQSLHWEDPLEKGMATHSVFLPRENPMIEESGRLQSIGLQKSWT